MLEEGKHTVHLCITAAFHNWTMTSLWLCSTTGKEKWSRRSYFLYKICLWFYFNTNLLNIICNTDLPLQEIARFYILYSDICCAQALVNVTKLCDILAFLTIAIYWLLLAHRHTIKECPLDGNQWNTCAEYN